MTRTRFFLNLPFLLYLYPTLALLLNKSQVHTILGFYSTFAFVFVVIHLLLYTTVITANKKQNDFLLLLCTLWVILLTILIVGSNISRLPMITVDLVLVKFFAGMSLATIAFSHKRVWRAIYTKSSVAIATIIIFVSLIDLLVLPFIVHRKNVTFRYREHYNWSEINDKHILIIGDSFVWGAGVKKEQRFGDALQKMISPTKVYSLGVPGASVKQYYQFLLDVPEKQRFHRVILSYYHNDMPGIQKFTTKLVHFSESISRSVPSMHFFQPLLHKMITPDVESYHDTLVQNYTTTHPSYPKRWKILQQSTQQCYNLIKKHTNSKPIFMIIPLMENYTDYRLQNAHKKLAKMAEDIGFQVLDLYPHFANKLQNGTSYRCKPNDSHFNANVHQLVAQILREHVD